mgnify:CR=1 FL=1
MENSVDALQIAGGLLIAILLITLIVFVFRSVSNMENTRRDLEVSQESAEFNKKFLAFDKTSMYGTDVISVLGMAISNNKIQNQQLMANPDGKYNKNVRYSMNIEIKVKNTVQSKVTKTAYIAQKDENGITQMVKITDASIYRGLGLSSNPEITQGDVILNGGTTYDLSPQDDEKYKKLEKLSTLDRNNIEKTSKRFGNKTVITEKDPIGINDFKKVIYKCTDVQYNEVGRIYYMKFEPKE